MPTVNLNKPELIISQTDYLPRTMVIKDEAKPVLRHATKDVRVQWAEVRAQGAVRIDGCEFNFQDIRVYLK